MVSPDRENGKHRLETVTGGLIWGTEVGTERITTVSLKGFWTGKVGIHRRRKTHAWQKVEFFSTWETVYIFNVEKEMIFNFKVLFIVLFFFIFVAIKRG